MSKQFIIVLLLLVIVSLGLFYKTSYHGSEVAVLKIFSAGSLKIPLEHVADVFEEKYGVDVHIEASGSVEAVRKIVDLGKTADILAVADYTLIEKYMIPGYTNWCVVFASNEIVLAYTPKSKYASEISSNPSRWYEVLARSDVKWGFSDPNKDPCGYRSLAVIVLSSIYYRDKTILKLITDNTNIVIRINESKILVKVPASLEIYSKNLVIRPKSVDLISLLEAGVIDYAFEYKSVAIQHNLSYIELPPQVNLGSIEYEELYNKVTVRILTGTSSQKDILIKTIAYGLTIPFKSRNREYAILFVKLLLSDIGHRIFSELGQKFLEKPLFYGNPPEELTS